MSNLHSRHLTKAAEALSGEFNAQDGLNYRIAVFSNRLHFNDPTFTANILPNCFHLINENLGNFYNSYGSSIYEYDGQDTEAWIQFKHREMLEKELVYLVVSETKDEENVVGFTSVAVSYPMVTEPGLLSKPCLFIYEIHIKKGLQSQGLGSNVFANLLIPLARKLDCQTIELCVFTANSNAIRWYERLGFVQSSRLGEDLIVMSRSA